MLNMIAVVVPVVGLIVAIVVSWGSAMNWRQLALFVASVELTALGVTVGFHRLFTHRAFATVGWIKYGLGALGSMSVQGTLLEWCSHHRKHHQHSDDHDDPHSPHHHAEGSWGAGMVGLARGFWHAHVGWLFAGRAKGQGKYVKDLAADPVAAAVNRHFRYWVYMGLVLPAVAGAAIEWAVLRTPMAAVWGAVMGLLWSGLVRIFFVHHVTWSVNSVCHLWGTRPFRTGDESRNNAIVGMLALGEGWHNNHHAFPNSARHGLRWWQLDLSYVFIRGLEMVGLAWNLKRPDAERMEAKKRV